MRQRGLTAGRESLASVMTCMGQGDGMQGQSSSLRLASERPSLRMGLSATVSCAIRYQA